MKKIISSFLVLLFFCQLCWSDILYLKDGRKLSGSITKETETTITIEGEDWWKEVPRSNIKEIVREKTPITLSTPVGKSKEELKADPESGIVLMIVGAGVTAIGYFIKFGEEKVTITATGIKYEEKSWNAVNYIVMGLGGILFIFGLSELSAGSETAKKLNEQQRYTINIDKNYIGIKLTKKF